VLALVKILAKLLMAAGAIGGLLAILAGLFRAEGSGVDSWWFVFLGLLWGAASLWVGLRIARSPDFLAVETVAMLVLYTPILVLAARLLWR
jgi:hypothetical protein